MRESINKNGFTQVDHITFDNILPTLSPSAQVVFLRIYRQTAGWNKPMDWISYSQFRKNTGIASNNTIITALLELKEKNLIMETGIPKRIHGYGINWKTVRSYK